MANSKDILIGSVCVALAQVSCGFTEVLVKVSEIKVVQFMITRAFISLLLSIILWYIKQPTVNGAIRNIYGDSKHMKYI